MPPGDDPRAASCSMQNEVHEMTNPGDEPVAGEDPTTDTPFTNEPAANEPVANKPVANEPETAPTAATEPPETLPPWPAPPQPGYSGAAGGGWAPPPGSPYPPFGASSTPPGPPSQQGWTIGRKLAAIVAVIALVLASAGIGAAVATRLHDNSTSFTSLSPRHSPSSGSSGSSSTGSVDMSAITAKVDPAVVNIYTTINNGQGQAAGTGMVITSNGEVLTNNHVISGATSISVQIGGTGSRHSAHVIGYDKTDDVALMKIDDVSGLKTISAGNVASVSAGDAVVAIGNALGRGGTPAAVEGRVAALNQSVTAGDNSGDAETLHGMIQVSASIQPGDSGGPLVNSNGEVIGMNTAASVGRFFQDSSSNVAFAIPIDKALSIVHQIERRDESGNVHLGARGILGVQVQSGSSSGGLFPFGGNGSSSQNGATVAGVESGSPADKAGIASGDVITAIDGKSISSASALSDALANSHPKDKVRVTWSDSSGQQHTATVRLASGPPA
jgi:S1-C subfamily serine protease